MTALTKSAVTWWHRSGFAPFGPDDPHALDLYLLTSDIAAALDGL